jgi:glutathione synthase/RimK-type ligase-like ATP-grasp enzyme
MTRPRRVALATAAHLPDAGPDETLLRDALRARGVAVSIAVWDDPGVAWSDFDLVLIRTTWDYSARRDAFLRWIDAVESVAPLHNPAAVVRANTHKGYLLELEAAGVPIPPTWFWPAGAARPDDLANPPEGDAFIVKPAVSASAAGLERWTRAELVERTTSQEFDRIVQPYLPRIETTGEISLVFFDGAFSHAVRKWPGAGDFRVQARHGGRWEAAQPQPAEVAVARAALETLDVAPLYARADLLDDETGAPVVGELELVEPELFLRSEPRSVARLATAIERRLLD